MKIRKNKQLIIMHQFHNYYKQKIFIDHFGNTCKLCDCFVYYTDRDVTTASVPYKSVHNPYESTEDRCLATCLNDPVKKL